LIIPEAEERKTEEVLPIHDVCLQLLRRFYLAVKNTVISLWGINHVQ